ncbi:hypothetical protein VTK73DRAFT_3264 [Phialemonium thermophilum]|uniref:SHSP domain-containing protein n=1 Tax=Phialemonium thermophilum TaxID=223376 RepID=A0ABR3Y8H9_9PEZI
MPSNFPPPPPFWAAGHPAGAPFWDFVRSFDPRGFEAGHGVDHSGPPGFDPRSFSGVAFGPGGFWAGHGRPGRGSWMGHGDPFSSSDPSFDHWGNHGGRHGGRRPWFRDSYSSDEEHVSRDDEKRDTAGEPQAEVQTQSGSDPEKEDSPGTVRDTPASDEHPDPPEEAPHVEENHRGSHWEPGRRFGGCRGGRGNPRGGRGHPHARGDPFHHPHPHPHHRHHPRHPRSGPHSGPPGPPPPYATGPHPPNAFDFSGLINAFAHHPFAQQLRDYAVRAQTQAQAAAAAFAATNAASQGAPAADSAAQDQRQEADNVEDVLGATRHVDDQAFTPPVDVFDGEAAWTVHVALPGAKREDVGVHWDAGESALVIRGVVHRPGDEAFQAGLVSAERRIGLFERIVKLPPGVPRASEGLEKEREEVDVDGIAARLEDGILIVVVPKLERDWTEVKKVDIE